MSRRRRRRCAQANADDRRRVRRLLSGRIAQRPRRLFRQSVRRRLRPDQSGLVVRRVGRPAVVQRRPHHRAGRGGAPDLSGGCRDLSPDGVDRDPAGRGRACGDSHSTRAKSRCRRKTCASPGRRRRSRSTNIRPGTQAFTAVVTAEAQQLSAEEALLSTQGQIQTDAVDLIVALGGGWTQSKLPDVAAQTSDIPPH